MPRYYPWQPQPYNPYGYHDPLAAYHTEILRSLSGGSSRSSENLDNLSKKLDTYFERTDKLLNLLNEIYKELNTPESDENLNLEVLIQQVSQTNSIVKIMVRKFFFEMAF